LPLIQFLIPTQMLINNNLQIGNNIRIWRVLKGLKQITVAKQIGLSKSTLSKIENDKTKISLYHLQKIATCFNIKTTQLFINPIDLLVASPRINDTLVISKAS